MNNQTYSNNYRVITESAKNTLRNGCPVLIQSATLLQNSADKKYYVRCAFEGMTGSAIKELFVDVILKSNGKEIARVTDFKYEPLGTARDSEFGANVGIPVEAEVDADTIEVVPKKVLLEDEEGNRTEALADGDLLTLPVQETLVDHFGDAELAGEYAIEANVAGSTEDSICPEKVGAYWICTCGNINHADEEVCHVCGNEAETLFDKLDDEESIRENLEARKAEEARIREEERVRQEEAKARMRKKAKIIAIILVILIVLAAGAYLFVTKALPGIRYNSANKAFESGDYEKAYTAFAKLEGYEDSDAKYMESYYQYGVSCLESGEYDEAEKVFEEIKVYKDSADQLNEAKYREAQILIDDGKYEDAVAAFKDLGEYSDSKDMKLKAMYGYVQENKDSKNETTYMYLKQLKEASYEKSASIFKELYAWKAKIVINNKENNAEDAKSSISKYDKVYCHVTLEGGEPGDTTKLRYKAVYPDGGAVTGSWDQSWSDGSDGQCSFWYDIPEYGTAGTLTIYIYDKGTGKQIGKDSVKLTN